MYVIVVGCGLVGSSMASRLAGEGHDVVVVDENPDAFALLGRGFPGQTIVGDAVDWDTLREASVEGADVLAATTRADIVNIVCALIARREFEVERVIARIYDPLRARVFEKAGIRTVCPTKQAALTMVDAAHLDALPRIGG